MRMGLGLGLRTDLLHLLLDLVHHLPEGLDVDVVVVRVHVLGALSVNLRDHVHGHGVGCLHRLIRRAGDWSVTRSGRVAEDGVAGSGNIARGRRSPLGCLDSLGVLSLLRMTRDSEGTAEEASKTETEKPSLHDE